MSPRNQQSRMTLRAVLALCLACAIMLGASASALADCSNRDGYLNTVIITQTSSIGYTGTQLRTKSQQAYGAPYCLAEDRLDLYKKNAAGTYVWIAYKSWATHMPDSNWDHISPGRTWYYTTGRGSYECLYQGYRISSHAAQLWDSFAHRWDRHTATKYGTY